MSKRDLAFLSATSNVDLEPRTKRRKETQSEEKDDVEMADDTKPVVEESGVPNGGMKEEVKEQGNKLWQAVKDAVNKEGRQISYEFLRLPSKRQYPDYYQLVKRPISLDEIKKELDHGSYKSLEAVRDDLEQCFTNAKKYNQKNSPIWLDAKVLHKVTKKEYAKLSGVKEEEPADGAEDGGEKGEGEGSPDGTKKAKVPNLYRQLKGRLQKLIDKTDDQGRVVSALFMELPSKKDYPTYYKEIKRPKALENIFRQLKRKEYMTSAEFASDVELVFSNAVAFNLEHSEVWEDAMILKEYFRQLMSDLPAPFALPEYAKAPRVTNKIKLKMNGNQASPPAPAQPSGSSSFTLRVPGGTEATKNPIASNVKVAQRSPQAGTTASPPARAQAAPSTSYANQLPVAPMTAQTYSIQPIQATPRQQPTPIQYTPQHYPNASYQPAVHHAPQPAPPTIQVTTSALPHINAVSFTKSPSPSYQRPLRGVLLTTKPRGRPLRLDHRDGVKSWAIRLGQAESSISVAKILFLADEEEEPLSDDDADEEEEEISDAEPSPRNGKGKAKRGRGRPKGTTRAAGKPKVTRNKPTLQKETTPLQDNVKIVLNGSVVQRKDDHDGEWTMELRLGPNVLEVGEEGGMVWKVYLERVAF